MFQDSLEQPTGGQSQTNSSDEIKISPFSFGSTVPSGDENLKKDLPEGSVGLFPSFMDQVNNIKIDSFEIRDKLQEFDNLREQQNASSENQDSSDASKIKQRVNSIEN